MKKYLIILIGIIYLGIDYQGYYYGLGKGILVKKIPESFKIIFAGSDLGNHGVVLKEDAIGGIYLIKSHYDAYLNSTKTDVLINDFLGYYFDKSSIIVEVSDNLSRNFV